MPTPQGQPAGQPVTWTVGVQMVTVGPDKAGKMVNGYEVPFTLSTGHTDSVFVAGADYNIDNIRAAIQVKAEQIVAVSRLAGTVS